MPARTGAEAMNFSVRAFVCFAVTALANLVDVSIRLCSATQVGLKRWPSVARTTCRICAFERRVGEHRIASTSGSIAAAVARFYKCKHTEHTHYIAVVSQSHACAHCRYPITFLLLILTQASKDFATSVQMCPGCANEEAAGMHPT